ncbi:hypothetical protein HK104_006193 [Borealophlyctis nickersoniae]|nr:hypothetical protein HK104_006193 [Borealophlyctis nickersoniae]
MTHPPAPSCAQTRTPVQSSPAGPNSRQMPLDSLPPSGVGSLSTAVQRPSSDNVQSILSPFLNLNLDASPLFTRLAMQEAAIQRLQAKESTNSATLDSLVTRTDDLEVLVHTIKTRLANLDAHFTQHRNQTDQILNAVQSAVYATGQERDKGLKVVDELIRALQRDVGVMHDALKRIQETANGSRDDAARAATDAARALEEAVRVGSDVKPRVGAVETGLRKMERQQELLMTRQERFAVGLEKNLKVLARMEKGAPDAEIGETHRTEKKKRDREEDESEAVSQAAGPSASETTSAPPSVTENTRTASASATSPPSIALAAEPTPVTASATDSNPEEDRPAKRTRRVGDIITGVSAGVAVAAAAVFSMGGPPPPS